MMEIRDVKLPLGLSSYERIKTEGYYYIDKTKYIEVIENNLYPVLLRPRRFGKTLFADTLRVYYDIKKKDNFDILFGDTYIGKHKTSKANRYYVLYLNFSGLDSRDSEKLEKSFGERIIGGILDFISYYDLEDLDFRETDEFISYTHNFLNALRNITSPKLYIIIDEYDHFANAMLGNKKELEKITDKDGFVRAFYEVLKIHAQFLIDQIFITGVTSITLDSLTSGFNITKNISDIPSMNSSIGFTLDEVTELIECMQIPDKKETLKLFKENYNGYLFSIMGERIYNSNMILYYLDSYLQRKRKPVKLTDSNMISDYKKLSGMFDLYDGQDKDQVLQSLMGNETLAGDLVTSFNLSTSFTYDHFISLLYYLGLITIEEELWDGGYEFRTPNQVIRDIYYDYYFTYLTQNSAISNYMIKEALAALEEDDEKVLVGLIEKMIGESTIEGNRYMIHFRENTLQTLFYLILRKSKSYNVLMESKTEAGYADILYSPIKGGIPYVFELKYLSESKYKEDNSLLEKAIADVNEQVDKDIKSFGEGKGIAVVFVGKNCKYHNLRK